MVSFIRCLPLLARDAYVRPLFNDIQWCGAFRVFGFYWLVVSLFNWILFCLFQLVGFL